MSPRLKLPEPEHYCKEYLMLRWGISSGQFDEYVSTGKLRVAWLIDTASATRAGLQHKMLSLDGCPNDIVDDLRNATGFFHTLGISDLDDCYPNKRLPEPAYFANLPLMDAPAYLYDTGFYFSTGDAGDQKCMLFATREQTPCLLISPPRHTREGWRMLAARAAPGDVVPRVEVEAFESKYAGGDPLPDNSGVEPYVPPPANQVNFTLGGDRNNRSESTATSPPQKQAEEGATVDQPAKFTDEQLLAYFRGSDTPYITGCAALEKAKLIRASYRKLRQEKGSEAPGADLHKMISAKHDRQRGFSVSSIRKSIKALDDAEKELACRAKPAPTS